MGARTARCRRLATALALALAFASLPAAATSDLLSGMMPSAGAGIGLALRTERSPYKSAGTRYDLFPLYYYEGDYAYLHGSRAGLKLERPGGRRYELFVQHRFEGYPSQNVPNGLSGTERRAPGLDLGVAAQLSGAWGEAYVELTRDVSSISHGSEAKLGYGFERRRGRWSLRPHAWLAFRSARLNDYYYGVQSSEAAPGRPAYEPGSGVSADAGFLAAYQLTEGWQLFADVGVTRLPNAVARSPIVDHRLVERLMVGGLYQFAPPKKQWTEGRPLIVRGLVGASTDCILLELVRFACTKTHQRDNTGIAGAGIGRYVARGLNGWPLDVAAMANLLRHREAGLQPDAWEVDLYLKAWYYGFPWSDRVRTRIGFGAGLSYADRVPAAEAREQARRGRPTSKLLQYLDPSVDLSVGDVFGSRRLHDLYFGFGVSHRSGIFGSASLFGNVNGGSNFVYTYLEWIL